MRGAKKLSKVRIQWSPEFAYAIGLITTDGSLSKDGRHLDFTSNDKEQIVNFMRCLNIKVKIRRKKSGSSKKQSMRIQFSDVNFYRFLLDIGLMPRKSKIITDVDIPNQYFFDFLRGHFDGDGTFYSYFDPRWRSSFMFYTVFISASKKHIHWLQSTLVRLAHIRGHITKSRMQSCYQLKYAKSDSLALLKKLYYADSVICLRRKYLKIQRALAIIRKV